MKIAKPIQDVIDGFSRLPGVGPKTAQRLAYYLLHVPQTEIDKFADSLSTLKRSTKICTICKNVSEVDPCEFCSDTSRIQDTILVVEQPLDILAFEKTGKYKGLYHCLHGAINPLDNIGPDEIFIDSLLSRIGKSEVKEVIIATNPTMEGEATAMYINNQLTVNSSQLKVTRLGMGIPTGAYLEFADEMTITQSLAGRRVI